MKLEDIKVTVDKPVTMTLAEYYASEINGIADEAEYYEQKIRQTMELHNLEPIGMFDRYSMGSNMFIGYSGILIENKSIENPFEKGMRLAVRKKKPQYRYVTDGVMRQGKDGEFWHSSSEGRFRKNEEGKVYPYADRLWYTREEVK